MRVPKLRVDLEDLAVQTFSTSQIQGRDGTVRSHWEAPPIDDEVSRLQSGCWSCASWCDTKCGSCTCAD